MRNKNVEQTYSLKELCREAQVTERTVRYYIQEGLLSPPEGAGPFARYSQQHLLRLRLIRRLKEEYLPLAEIRRRLSALEPEELETLAQQTLAETEYDEEEADAKKYLDRLLSRGTQAATSYSVQENKSVYPAPASPPAAEQSRWPVPVAPAKPPIVPEPPGAPRAKQSEPLADAQENSPTLEGESWQRVTLAPGVELHYQPRDPKQRGLIAKLVEQARHIFE